MGSRQLACISVQRGTAQYLLEAFPHEEAPSAQCERVNTNKSTQPRKPSTSTQLALGMLQALLAGFLRCIGAFVAKWLLGLDWG